MFAEVAKPITFLVCILCLCAVFNSAFLSSSIDLDQKICNSLVMLALAAAICLVSGMIFRDAKEDRSSGKRALTATLPVQVFCWTSLIMVVLFVISWYLETHCVFYRDVQRF